MHLQAVLIPVILEISSMSLNGEASHVLFLNQTLLQIEKYMKNGLLTFQLFLADGSGCTLYDCET